ncbi:MAG TPA: [protein-PII] uridylyltransferase, partial [Xanthomonadales bacterium]|nr:[protein-PII] uridylyltransferase [Xanthomonadales bacterium]
MRLPAPADAARWWPARPAGGSQRAALDALEQAQNDAFERDVPVEALVRARAWAIEQAVLARWDAQGEALAATTLVATGGFGRGEMHPRSDVDLLLLVPDTADAARSAAIERFVAGLWDDGLKVGHAVRDVAAAAEAARADITVMSSLLDARWLAGPQAPLAALRAATSADAMWSAEDFAAAKLAEQHARHARYNDTAYNLEPNLKEGPGGLRELSMPLWIAQRQLGLGTLEALRDAHLLGAEEYDALVAARRTLWRIRFALHAASRKAEERLLFEHQRELAKRFGLRDEHAGNLAVEQFMQGYFRAAMAIERLGERVLQRLAEARAAEPGSIGVLPSRELDDDFLAIAGYLDARIPGLFERDPSAIIRAFRMLLDHPELRGFRSMLLRQLDWVLPGLDEGFRRNPRVNHEFMALLQHEGDVPEALQRMSRYGVLGRYLPAFGHVAGRMQYDLFHAYTVDQHTLFVLRNLHGFGDPAAAKDFPLAHELHSRLRKPELLLLAGLFHDIAKGRGGDHSELGEQDARAFCAQVGLPPADADLVAWLVREHLLMSVTAQKQDIADPAVVHRFAERVGDRERLDYLYLLTVGDIRGTSPKLWNSWKDRLLADLHEATRYALRRGLAKPVHASERIAETKQAALAALLAAGEDEARIAALWNDFPDDSFVRYSADQVAWLTTTLLHAPP